MGYFPSKSEENDRSPVPPSPIRPDDVVIDKENESQYYYSVVAIQGRRTAMEDTFSHIISEYAHLFGVYDGHGSDRVSIYLKKFILDRIHEKLLKFSNDQSKAEILKESFLEINAEYQQTASASKTGGSTAVVGIIYKEGEVYKLAVANTRDIS